MFKPDPAIIRRISQIGGIDHASLHNATLARFGKGLPLVLDGLDPCRRHSFRRVVTQGWFPAHGSQACPECLREKGKWALTWRLPIVTACIAHKAFLLTQCAGCGRRFRSRRHLPMRPEFGPQQPCGNPVGSQHHCTHSIVSQAPRAAPQRVLHVTTVIGHAMDGQRITMLGEKTDPRTYLAALRHVASLLLHLLAVQPAAETADWAREIHSEILDRTPPRRGPRWGISPPKSAVLRGHVLAEADAILNQTTVSDAGNRLARWLTPMVSSPTGPSNWMRNRIARTAITEKLIPAATSERHHVGRRIDSARHLNGLPLSAIPQQLDLDIYHEFFDGMLGGYEWTGRLYASLCIARSVSQAANWSDAAAELGLDPTMGRRTARAAMHRMSCRPAEFAVAVRRGQDALPRDRDFRVRECRVVALARSPSEWFEQWRWSTTPARRAGALPYAISWMWCEVAQGLLDTGPAWTRPATRQAKAAYRVFRGSLPQPAQSDLRRLILNGPKV
jgi:TniQ